MWNTLQAAAMTKIVGHQYVPLHSWKALSILEGRELGAARLRLLPKKTGAAQQTFLVLSLPVTRPPVRDRLLLTVSFV